MRQNEGQKQTNTAYKLYIDQAATELKEHKKGISYLSIDIAMFVSNSQCLAIPADGSSG